MTPDQRRQIHDAMVRFADGDRTAFRTVFDGLWPVLLGISARSLAVRADAEDAAQHALLKVFSRIADMDRGRDGVAWAITIASFEVMTARRQRQRRREAPDDALMATADHAPQADERVWRAQMNDAVRATVGGLAERDQVALAAWLDEAAPTAPTETVRKRRFRAIERLRAAWRNAHG
jgi:DNA-directed RNA polymerase specialized sigma24 family protein